MSTDLVHSPAPIAIPPALAQAGVTVVEEHGVRTVQIPVALQQSHNVVQPVSEMTQADPDWSPRLVVVDLSGEQYSYTEQGKQALTKNGILLLAHAAGIEVDVNPMPRNQLRDEEIGYKATATVRRSDGTIARWSASKVANLDDEKKAIEGTRKTWLVEKAHLPAKTESKAVLRACAEALQLKRGGYTKADLLKPFLIVGVSSTPSDPDVRRARALQAGQDAYGKRALPPMDETSQYEEMVPHGHDRLDAPAPSADVVDAVPASAQPQEPVSDEPDPTPSAGEIPPDIAVAGEMIVPKGLKPAGQPIRQLDLRYLRFLAGVNAEGEGKNFTIPAADRLAPGESIEAYETLKRAAETFLPWRVANPGAWTS